MNNIEKAKASLQKAAQIETIIIQNTAQKTRKFRVPLVRDINMIENELRNKISPKRDAIIKEVIEYTENTNKAALQAIRDAAVTLGREIDALRKKIEIDSNGAISLVEGRYDGFWGVMPITDADALKDKPINVINYKPYTDPLEKESEQLMFDIKLGIRPVSDIKAVMDKIDAYVI